MQIGSSELDKVCEKAILPSLRANELDPKRVDKHNQGGLLKNEIIGFIENSDIIVADLTNERPNCYLEIGYAMGVDKFRNLILTAREDHLPGNPNHKVGGPKIHFDLAGYDILFWNPEKLDEFREELTKRIRRRLVIVAPSNATQLPIWDEEWLKENRNKALAGLTNNGRTGFMEIRHALIDFQIQVSPKNLLLAAEQAQIHTFGWPIGIVLPTPQDRPRPRADGITVEISSTFNAYDYWVLRRNGDFYLLKSLFEDESGRSKSDVIFFNTRIVRTTEALLHCARLYNNFEVDPTVEIEFAIKYGGLENRKLSSSSPSRMLSYYENREEKEIEMVEHIHLGSIESQLVENVKKFTAPLFSLFDFFELSDSVYEDIVNKFVEGKVT